MENKKTDLKEDDLKALVKTKYGEIAQQSKQQNESSCCGAGGSCSNVDYTIFSENYDTVEGYNPEADLGLGCGIPTEFAQIKAGDTVIDLGSGAGNDCFVARALVGEAGKVIGAAPSKFSPPGGQRSTRSGKRGGHLRAGVEGSAQELW